VKAQTRISLLLNVFVSEIR